MYIWRRLLSFLLLTAVARAEPAASRPANCTVQGQVVQQASGLPIRKVDIRLYSIGEYQESEDIKYTAVTDAEGRFKFEGVKPDRYRLFFQRAGFIDVEKRRHGSGMLLSLEPGQDLTNLLFHTSAITQNRPLSIT